MEQAVIKRIWGNPDVGFSISSSEGASGGLLTLWNSEIFKPHAITSHKHFILVEGTQGNGFQCVFLNIYAPNNPISRRNLWMELSLLKSTSQSLWCVGGDFNSIKSISAERVGCTRMDRDMRDFIDFINIMELQDLPLLGREFTWSNFQDVEIQSRIDRFLLSQEFLDKFNLTQWGLHRPISDHSPIMLAEDSRNWGPKPFRFQDAWLSNPSCMSLAKEVWNCSIVHGWSGYKLMQKLKAVKEKLKLWNKEVFGDINVKLQVLEEKLHQMDILSEERVLTSEEKLSKRSLKSEFWKCNRLAETLWRQKSRIN